MVNLTQPSIVMLINTPLPSFPFRLVLYLCISSSLLSLTVFYLMSCNGCRVLRKGCSETCVLRSSLRWIESPEAQGSATLFLAKFFGRSDLLSFISSVPEHQRPGTPQKIFQFSIYIIEFLFYFLRIFKSCFFFLDFLQLCFSLYCLRHVVVQ